MYKALLTIVSSVIFNVQFFRVRTDLGVCWVDVYSSDHRNISYHIISLRKSYFLQSLKAITLEKNLPLISKVFDLKI